MTPRQRIVAAMNLQVPDRTPLMCQLSIGHMLVQLDVSPVEFWYDPDVFADGLVKLRELYDFDGILVSLHGHDPSWRLQVKARRNTADGESVLFHDGTEMIFPPADLPQSVYQRNPQGRPIAEWSEKDLPPALDYIPVSIGLHFRIDPGHRFDVFEQVAQKAGPDYSIHGEVTSPFDYFLDFAGYEQGLVSLVREPRKSKLVLAHFGRLVSELAGDMCSAPVDAVKISSPFAGSSFISRDHYKQFVLPFESLVVDAVRSRGKHAYLHTCGAVGDRLDLMFDSGASGIECLDPPPLGTVELAEAKKLTKGRGFIKGNVDSVNTLLTQGRDEILRDAQDRIMVGKDGGGFILSTACSVAPHVPRASLRLLREAVEQWG